MSLEIVALAAKKPFVGKNNKFYCGVCNRYTMNFTPSSIKNKDRRCRKCLRWQGIQTRKHFGHLQRLKMNLYQNFLYQKKTSYARALTIATVASVLENHGIHEASYATVKTMKPVFNHVDQAWMVTPVFFDIASDPED